MSGPAGTPSNDDTTAAPAQRGALTLASWFVLGVAAALVLGELASGRLPFARGRMHWPAAATHELDDEFVAEKGWNTTDHYVMFHGLGGTPAFARAADILILGNSRSQHGLRGEFVLPIAQRAGVRAYHLGFGHSETWEFPMTLMKRHDLRPKVVVINEDGFFTAESWIAPGVRASRRWEAIKIQLEIEIGLPVTQWLHRLVPRYGPFMEDDEIQSLIYRSYSNGFWRVGSVPNLGVPVDDAGDPDPAIAGLRLDGEGQVVDVGPAPEKCLAQLENARTFRRFVDERGGIVVLTHVPFPARNRAEEAVCLRWIAAEQRWPVVLSTATGLLSSDGSHLDARSAQLVSEDVFPRILALGVVRTALAGRPPAASAP